MPYNDPIPERNRPPRKDSDGAREDSGSPRKDSGGLATLVQAEKLMQIAILLPSAAFIGWLGGAWLDKALHQTWIALVGIAFGGIAGLVYVVRLVLASGKDEGKRGSQL